MLIQKFDYSDEGKLNLDKVTQGKDWPVVYMISNDRDLYIGETTSASTRMGQHLKNAKKQKMGFKEIRVVFDDEYNKSVILDYEQRLIKYCKADKKYNVINGNEGQSASHNYYNRDHYSNSFDSLWREVIKEGLADKALSVLENQAIFKYSPFNALTEEQNLICIDLLNDICDKLEGQKSGTEFKGISVVDGCAGTGKTILAISLINLLVNATKMDIDDLVETGINAEKLKAITRLKTYIESSSGHELSVAIVFPMTSIRATIKRVFKECGNGLRADMVIGPCDLDKKHYDIVLVDESHRLTKRHNIQGYGAYDKTCKNLGFTPDTATQLDWVIKQGSYNVLFYDKDQRVKGADISFNQFDDTIVKSGKPTRFFQLTTQMRCRGGSTYLSYIKAIMGCNIALSFKDILNYEFRIFDDVDQMISKIKDWDAKPDVGLSKTVAGYSWKWITKPKKDPADDMTEYNKIVASGKYDIEIQGHRYIWNLTTKNWIPRKDSHDTIGCIHTSQGFDLNYVGVIFGEEIDYDPKTNSIVIDTKKLFDINVRKGCTDSEIKTFIINTYTTMLARGIKGCYVYACNKNLREYLQKYIRKY